MTLTKKIFGTLAIAVLLLNAYGCSENNAETIETKKVINSVSVEAINLRGESFTDYISVIGTIKPYQKALISVSEGGKIVKFYVDKGDFVNKGDTILVIDNEILAANLQAAKAQFELAEITYKKQKMIYEDNVNSEIQYLQAKYSMQQLEANYKLAKARFNNTIITAPFSGYIDSKYFDISEIAPAGQPIIQLIDVSKVKIEAGVPEKYISTVKKNNLANVKVQMLNQEVKGKISFVGTSVNNSNRTFPIEITLQNNNKLLKPELIAEVKIENETFKDIIVIPNEVISRVDNGFIVYIVKNGKAKTRNIEIQRRTSNHVAVASGLNNNDSLIVVGYQNLVDGQAVNVVK